MSRASVRHRRGALAVGAVTAALALSACGGASTTSGGTSGSTTITVVSYGGPYQEAQAKAFFDPYVAANPNIKIVQDNPSDNAKLKAMVDAGKPTWDLVLLANDFGNEAQGKWLEPIDYTVVDKTQLADGFAGKYRVGADVEGTVVAYRSDKAGGDPSGWQDFFDLKKFPGKRAINKYSAGGVLEAALLADGVAQDKLYPLDVDRALRKLGSIKNQIVWWETAAQSQQLLASGEVAMGMVWVGRAVDAGKAAPVKINWNTWLSQDAYWMIPKGAPHKAEAMKLINYMIQKDSQKKFTELIVYGTVNKDAAKDPQVSANTNRPSNHLDTRITMNDQWWAENQEATDQKFQSWLLS